MSDNDQLVYVKDVLKGKLMESEVLRKQAARNMKEQFAASPDLPKELVSTIVEVMDADEAMSTQALDSGRLKADLKDILLGLGRLYEDQRQSSRHSMTWGLSSAV